MRINDLQTRDGPPVQLGDEILEVMPHKRQFVRPRGLTERLGGVRIIGRG